jgi:hypothetical protein
MTNTHRLGAIELIELGGSRRLPTLRRPFLSNRSLSGPRLGVDFLASIGSFLTGAFEFLFKTLGSLIDVPLKLLGSGVGVIFDGLAGLLVNFPIIGVFASQLLLITKSVIQWGLSVPGLLLGGLGNVFGGIKKAIDATQTPAKKKENEAAGKEKILDKAEQKGGTSFRTIVDQVLGGKVPPGVTGVPPLQPLPPGGEGIGVSTGDLNQLLGIGLPIAGAATLAFLLLK